jgi:hypothetical protein
LLRIIYFSAVLVGLYAFTRVSFAAQPVLTPDDYEQVGTAILKAETSPDARGTIFVGFAGFDSRALVPAFQRIYRGSAIVETNGEDWGTTSNGCHVDKSRHTMATGIFVSRPTWRGRNEIAFLVTFAACSIGSHINTYVFDRQGHHWVLETAEPRAIS